MLKSLTRSIKLMAKDEFDTSLYKATLEDDVEEPKEKHINIIIECLKGEHPKVSPLDAFIKFDHCLVQQSCLKWKKTLKYCYILHLSIIVLLILYSMKNNCKLFIEAMCTNDLFKKFKSQQTVSILTDDLQIYLYSTISSNYMTLLKTQYENYLFFQNTLADFDQKEESQQIFIMQKIVSMLLLLTKMYKEFDISFQKFPNNKLITSLANLLNNDIIQYYPQVIHFLKPRVDLITIKEEKIAFKLYTLYSDALRLSRAIKQMLSLQAFLPKQQKTSPQIEIFQVDIIKNKEIEKHFCKRSTTIINEEKKEFVHQTPQTSRSVFSSQMVQASQPNEQKQKQELQKSQSQLIQRKKDHPTLSQGFARNNEPRPFDATTQFTTQHSILTFSDIQEPRVFGLSRQGSSILSSEPKTNRGFFEAKNSPLGFMQQDK